MSKSWRERIAEARERGWFTDEDYRAWTDGRTCLVGEVVRSLWGDEAVDTHRWCDLDGALPLICGCQTGLADALTHNDFAFVERRLGEIEDVALQLKREQAS